MSSAKQRPFGLGLNVLREVQDMDTSDRKNNTRAALLLYRGAVLYIWTYRA